MQKILDVISQYHKSILEASTAYGTGLTLMFQHVNWAAVGGLVLFIARACVDIPRAIDYWKNKHNENKKEN